ncbi:MAG: Ig-like domain-containing protein [Clostridium sp.]|nr:Ig-like domain-containing protein [Clostridium sp.]
MKNRKKQLVAWMLTILLVLGMTPDMGAVQAAKKMALNKKKITLQVGAKTKLKVKNTKKKVTWKTSNKKIVKVNKTGKVTALKKGNAEITAKVAGKKLICKVKVVPKKKKNTTEAGTTEAAKNIDTPTDPVTPTNPVTPAPSDDNNKQDNDKQDNKNDTDKSLKLSDITFEDGYSTQDFEVSFEIPVTDYHDYLYDEEDNDDEFECDDKVVGCIGDSWYTIEREDGRYKGGWTLHIIKQGDAYVLKGTEEIPIGNYTVLFNDLYGGTITTEDFTDLTYTEKTSNGYKGLKAQLKKLPLKKMVSVTGQITDCNNKALTDGYVTVKQTVEGKEYIQTADVYGEGHYTLELIDNPNYTYTVIPMGFEEKAFEVSVKNGQPDRTDWNIKLNVAFQTVLFKKEDFKPYDRGDLELRSGNTVINLMNYGLNYKGEAKIQVPIGTYDVYYDGYLIQKGLEITANTTSVTIQNPTYSVELQMDGEAVSLEDYYIEKKNDTFDSFFQYNEEEVGIGIYRIYQKGYRADCIGEFRVDADAADKDGIVVWNIAMAKVILKNFDATKNLSDYIIKHSNAEEPIEDPDKLCAGKYKVYTKTEEGEAGEECGTFEITLEDAKKGSVIWQMGVTEISGRIEIPTWIGLPIQFDTLQLTIYQKDEQTSRYKEVKTVDCGTLKTHLDETQTSNIYLSYQYIDLYTVNLKKGEYVFELTCRGGDNNYDSRVEPVAVTVDGKTMKRDIIVKQVSVGFSSGCDLSGLYIRLGDASSAWYGINDTKEISVKIDCNATYDLYVKDSAGVEKKVYTGSIYDACKNGQKIALDDEVLSQLHSHVLPVNETILASNSRSVEVRGTDGKYSSVQVKDNKCTVRLFADGEYEIIGSSDREGSSWTYDKKLGTLTLKNGVFQYTPAQ